MLNTMFFNKISYTYVFMFLKIVTIRKFKILCVAHIILLLFSFLDFSRGKKVVYFHLTEHEGHLNCPASGILDFPSNI